MQKLTSEQKKADYTFGQKCVGYTFNPSGDARVNQVKMGVARAIDVLNESNDFQPMGRSHREEAIKHLMTAQMWAVKAITSKD